VPKPLPKAKGNVLNNVGGTRTLRDLPGLGAGPHGQRTKFTFLLRAEQAANPDESGTSSQPIGKRSHDTGTPAQVCSRQVVTTGLFFSLPHWMEVVPRWVMEGCSPVEARQLTLGMVPSYHRMQDIPVRGL
jgi:hypothetical protein